MQKIELIDKFLKNIELFCKSKLQRATDAGLKKQLKEYNDTMDEMLDAAELYSWLKYTSSSKNSRTIVSDFSILFPVLINSQLTKKEQIDIIFYIIECNICYGILDENISIDNKFLQTKLSLSEVFNRDVIHSHIEDFRKIFLDFTERKDKLNTLPQTTKENELGNIIKAHREILDHYLNKKDCYNEADVKTVIDALIALNVPLTFIYSIEKYLRKPFEKKGEKIVPSLKGKYHVEPKMPLTKKVYNKIYKELLEYFDFDKMIALRCLRLEEIIYCIYLLKKLNFDENTIRLFLAKAEKYNRINENPIIRYNDFQKKLSSCQNSDEVMHLVSEINEAYANLFIANDKDYELYKKYIAEELNNLSTLVEDNYKYEFDMALKLEKKDI